MQTKWCSLKKMPYYPPLENIDFKPYIMKTILVTGAHGQVGSELQSLASSFHHFNFIFTNVEDLDITNLEAVMAFTTNNPFHYCINCAAYTAVDTAENNQALAQKINVEGAENLAKACATLGATMIHISTDYVYHNDYHNLPFKENDNTSPQGVYAATKLAGDEVVLAQHTQSIVLRTSWVYSTFGNNFVKTMLRLGEKLDEIKVIYDQIGSPTYAKDLAKAILDIIQKMEKENLEPSALRGIYHYSNEGVLSWYDFAKAIFEIKQINCKVTPIETKDYPTAAKRPPFSLLNKAKIKTTFDIEIPYWRDSLKICLEKL